MEEGERMKRQIWLPRSARAPRSETAAISESPRQKHQCAGAPTYLHALHESSTEPVMSLTSSPWAPGSVTHLAAHMESLCAFSFLSSRLSRIVVSDSASEALSV